MPNQHYRIRTPEQVQKKIDRLKTDFMVRKIMGDTRRDTLKRMLSNFPWRKKAVDRLMKPERQEIRKVKRLERKLRRIKEGKWRKSGV